MNPLGQLCRQMGIAAGPLAKEIGLRVDDVEAALSEQPGAVLRAYIEATRAIGAKMRVTCTMGFGFWFHTSEIDRLYRDTTWREQQGWLPFPATRSALRDLIRRLRMQGLSYSSICEQLETSWIPTAMGVRGWRKSTIGQTLKEHAATDGDMPVSPDGEMWTAFSDHFWQLLTTGACPLDPMVAVRYEISLTLDGDRSIARAAKPVPQAIRESFLNGLARLGWFPPGAWGESAGDKAST